MKRISRFHRLIFVFIFLTLVLIVAEVPKSEAVSSSSKDKALSFLRDVIGLDMSKYTATMTKSSSPSAGEEYITYRLDKFLTSQVDASFIFFNGNLGDCNLNPNYGQLLYSKPGIDPFNRTLQLVENYQWWLNDTQVGEMANLLNRAGSIHNATEFSGNLTMKIIVYSPTYTVVKFSNTFNDVDYTGLSLTFGSGSVIYFDDNRAYKTIGDTSINISKEQAIAIAENYVRYNYSYVHDFGNGTKLTVSGLNVTGVGTVQLGTRVFNPNDNITSLNQTLSPYWYIPLYVSNLPAPGLKGVAVQVSANDGTVVSPILFGGPFDLSRFFMLPSILFVEILSIITIIAGVVFVTTGILLHARRRHEKEPKQE